jgi:hypothetical protein
VKSGRVLDLDPNDRVTLVQFSPRQSPTQVWEISPAAPDYYIRHAATGRALEFVRDSNASHVVAQSTGENPNQSWQIQARGSGVWLLSRFRKALDVPSGSDREGLPLQIYDRSGEGNQQFVMRRVAVVNTRNEDRRDGRRDDRRDDRGGDRGRPDANGRFYDDRDQMWKVDGDGVCFYRERDFRGDAICTRAGQDQPDLGRSGGGSFQSLKFFGRVRAVQVFDRASFRGAAVRINGDQSDLGRVRIGQVGSFKVQ